jgi:hypothetical protein
MMTEGVENLVLEQLRLIRDTLAKMERRIDGLADDVGELKTSVQGQTGMIMALAGYVRDIDVRVEHLEQKIGASQ